MLKIKIYNHDNDLVFAGYAPEESVVFTEWINRPKTATFSLPVSDAMSFLTSVPVRCTCEASVLQSFAVNGDKQVCMICHREVE
jgi:hypothetical protein